MSNFDHPDRANQKISFEGIVRRGNLKPTDIDGMQAEIISIGGMQEYNGYLFIYYEAKLAGKRISDAQRLALTRICESYKESSKYFAWAFIFEHNTDKDEEIIAKDQYVIDVISSEFPEWRTPDSDEVVPKFTLNDNKLTVLEAIEQIENWCHENNIKIGK